MEKTKKLLRFQRATTERQKIVFPPGSTPNLTLAGEIVRVALLLFHSSCAAHNNTSKRTSTTPPRLPPPHRQERIHGLRRTRTTCVSARSPACPVGRPPRVRTVTTGGGFCFLGGELCQVRENTEFVGETSRTAPTSAGRRQLAPSARLVTAPRSRPTAPRSRLRRRPWWGVHS